MASVSDAELRRNAREIVEGKFGFYIHLATYAAVNLLIFLAWWFTGAAYVWGVFPWFAFPLVFWGAGVSVHYVCVFTPYSGLGYIQRKTEQEFQKLKRDEEELRRRREEMAKA